MPSGSATLVDLVASRDDINISPVISGITSGIFPVPPYCPAGSTVIVECWGAGSGGGGRSSGAAFGAGGGGGAYAKSNYVIQSADTTNGIPFTIGQGGSGGTGANSTAGSATNFGTSNINLLPNSLMVGGRTGLVSASTLPVGWSSARLPPGTNFIGYGVSGGLPYVDVQFVGNTGGTNVNFELQFAALYYTGFPGATAFSQGISLALIAGSLANITQVNHNFDLYGNSGYLNTFTTIVTGLTSTLARYTATAAAGSVAASATIRLFSKIHFNAPINSDIDITLRIAGIEVNQATTAPTWHPSPVYTEAKGAAATSGTTGAIGGVLSSLQGMYPILQGGNGAAYNAAGSGGGGSGGPDGAGGNGTIAGAGGPGDGSSGGIGGVVSAASPGNSGGSSVNGGGGGGSTTFADGTGGIGGFPGGGGGAAVVYGTGTPVGGAGANGQIRITGFAYISLSDVVSSSDVVTVTALFVTLDDTHASSDAPTALLASAFSLSDTSASSGVPSLTGNSQTYSDSFTSSDGLTFAAAGVYTFAETIASTDAVTETASSFAPVTITDTFTSSDTWSATSASVASLSDTGALSDTNTETGFVIPPVTIPTDSATSSDSYSGTFVNSLSLSDGIASTDNRSMVLGYFLSYSDSFVSDDTLTPLLSSSSSWSTVATPTDANTWVLGLTLNFVDTSVATSDSLTGLTDAPVTISETVTVSDTVVETIATSSGGLSDGIASLDSVIVSVLGILDQALTLDAVAGLPFTIGISITDSAVLSETMTLAGFVASLSDSMASSDTRSVTYDTTDLFSGSGVLTDALSELTMSSVGTTVNTVASTDSIILLTFTSDLTLSDTFASTDAVVNLTQQLFNIDDTATSADTLTAGSAYVNTVADTSVYTEFLDDVLVIQPATLSTNSAAASDTLAVIFTAIVPVNDTAITTEAVAGMLSIPPGSLSDAVVSSDSFGTNAIAYVISMSDTVDSSDAFTFANRTYNLSWVETILAQESLIPVFTMTGRFQDSTFTGDFLPVTGGMTPETTLVTDYHPASKREHRLE